MFKIKTQNNKNLTKEKQTCMQKYYKTKAKTGLELKSTQNLAKMHLRRC